MMIRPDIDKCPFCGNDEYAAREYVQGVIMYRMRFDGEESDNNSTLYDALTTKRISKYVYCTKCNKRLFRRQTTNDRH